jgi:L-cysteine:1D-myo-inositol 2-amino-2-deoxy-alpha-D-glucopyranoside ligase
MTLGVPVTIHGGGTDLIFPHHASEIAQAESIHHAVPFVRHWMHTAMVGYQGEKMSKSLGNLVLVRELLNRYSADAVRLYLLSHHYRAEFEFAEGDLQEIADLAERFRLAVRLDGVGVDPDERVIAELRALLWQDLDTPAAVRRAAALLDTPGENIAAKTAAAIRWLVETLGLTLIAPAVLEAGQTA